MMNNNDIELVQVEADARFQMSRVEGLDLVPRVVEERVDMVEGRTCGPSLIVAEQEDA